MVKPKWLDITLKHPPPTTLWHPPPPKVKFPEEKLYKSFLARYPMLQLESRQQHPMYGQRRTPYERMELLAGKESPYSSRGTHKLSTLGPRFVRKQHELITANKMSEKDAFLECQKEFHKELEAFGDTVVAACSPGQWDFGGMNTTEQIRNRLRKIKQVSSVDLQTIFEQASRNGHGLQNQPDAQPPYSSFTDFQTRSKWVKITQERQTMDHIERNQTEDLELGPLSQRLLIYIQGQIEIAQERNLYAEKLKRRLVHGRPLPLSFSELVDDAMTVLPPAKVSKEKESVNRMMAEVSARKRQFRHQRRKDYEDYCRRTGTPLPRRLSRARGPATEQDDIVALDRRLAELRSQPVVTPEGRTDVETELEKEAEKYEDPGNEYLDEFGDLDLDLG
jgi:hypothetical protein